MKDNPANQSQPPEMQTDNSNAPQVEEIGFPLVEEIDRLEDMIMDGFRIPIVNKTLVDEETITRQLDEIRINIPDCYAQALEILAQREKMINDAQNYAQKIVENAQRKASQLLEESRIVRQAEDHAQQMLRQVQDDCKNLQRKTMSEVEQVRGKIQHEATHMKKQAIVEADEIHREADNYADSVLSRLERDLGEMLRIVSNGRQQIRPQHPAPQVNRSPQPPQNMKINQKAS